MHSLPVCCSHFRDIAANELPCHPDGSTPHRRAARLGMGSADGKARMTATARSLAFVFADTACRPRSGVSVHPTRRPRRNGRHCPPYLLTALTSSPSRPPLTYKYRPRRRTHRNRESWRLRAARRLVIIAAAAVAAVATIAAAAALAGRAALAAAAAAALFPPTRNLRLAAPPSPSPPISQLPSPPSPQSQAPLKSLPPIISPPKTLPAPPSPSPSP